MTLQTALAFIFTVLASVSFIAIIILLGWFLIWKAFLSKFRLVRELIGQQEDEIQQELEADPLLIQQQAKLRKTRRD